MFSNEHLLFSWATGARFEAWQDVFAISQDNLISGIRLPCKVMPLSKEYSFRGFGYCTWPYCYFGDVIKKQLFLSQTSTATVTRAKVLCHVWTTQARSCLQQEEEEEGVKVGLLPPHPSLVRNLFTLRLEP